MIKDIIIYLNQAKPKLWIGVFPALHGAVGLILGVALCRTLKVKAPVITLGRCARLAGLNPDEFVGGVAPEARHRTLLKSYRLSPHHGRTSVRRMIIRDLLACIDIGAQACAADLLVVLRLFLSEEGDIRRRVDRRPVREPSALSKPRRANVAHLAPAWRERTVTLPLNAPASP